MFFDKNDTQTTTLYKINKLLTINVSVRKQVLTKNKEANEKDFFFYANSSRTAH